MQYPQYQESLNLYIDGELILENYEAPEPILQGICNGCKIDEPYPETLHRLLKTQAQGQWVFSDENQQGMRGRFEYKIWGDGKKKSRKAVFFVCAQQCELTNDVPSPPTATERTAAEKGWRLYKVETHYKAGRHLFLFESLQSPSLRVGTGVWAETEEKAVQLLPARDRIHPYRTYGRNPNF